MPFSIICGYSLTTGVYEFVKTFVPIADLIISPTLTFTIGVTLKIQLVHKSELSAIIYSILVDFTPIARRSFQNILSDLTCEVSAPFAGTTQFLGSNLVGTRSPI